MGVVAFPGAEGTIALVDPTAQPGAVAQGICPLLRRGLHRRGLGDRSGDRLALAICLPATGRPGQPDLRRGHFPHSLPRLQGVLDDLTQGIRGVPESVYPDCPLRLVFALDLVHSHVVLQSMCAILHAVVVAYQHI